MELGLPFQDARARGGCLGLRNMTGSLKRDGERRMGERIFRSEDCQRHGGCHGVIVLAGITERPHEAVMCLDVARIRLDGRTKCMGCACGVSCAEQIEAAFAEAVGRI